VAGTTFQGSGKRAGITGINVTPMVDIMLVLLVIMMVSANFIVSQAMNVDLPKPRTAIARRRRWRSS
jgi:biopolymer transport protein ExbD